MVMNTFAAFSSLIAGSVGASTRGLVEGDIRAGVFLGHFKNRFVVLCHEAKKYIGLLESVRYDIDLSRNLSM